MYSKFLKVTNKSSVGVYEIPGDAFVISGTTDDGERYKDDKICFTEAAMFQLYAIMVNWSKRKK